MSRFGHWLHLNQFGEYVEWKKDASGKMELVPVCDAAGVPKVPPGQAVAEFLDPAHARKTKSHQGYASLACVAGAGTSARRNTRCASEGAYIHCSGTNDHAGRANSYSLIAGAIGTASQ
jgi:hypothetical protein